MVQTEGARNDATLPVIQSQSEYHQEWQFRRKDGSVFGGEVIETMMPDGNLMGLIRDVTERKNAGVSERGVGPQSGAR